MTNTYIEQSKELSVKEIILGIKKYVIEIIKNWLIVVIVTIFISGYMSYKALVSPVTYRADLTFMVNEDEGGLGAGSAAVGILGSLGIGSTEYNLDKILQLSRSFRIISDAFFVKANINGVEDFYANHLIRCQFKEGSSDYNFKFTHSDINKFSIAELSMLKRLFQMVSGGEDNASTGLLITSYEKLSGIMKMSLTTKDENVSIFFLRTVYERLGDFYVKKSIEKQKFTYEVILSKADSLKQLLGNRESARANFDDRNRGLISETSKVPAQRLTRDLGMLSIMYNEAIRNAEVADFAIKSKIPFVQSIDIPISPLKPKKASIFKNIFIGFIIGFLLSSSFIIIKKIIKDALNENENI